MVIFKINFRKKFEPPIHMCIKNLQVVVAVAQTKQKSSTKGKKSHVSKVILVTSVTKNTPILFIVY